MKDTDLVGKVFEHCKPGSQQGRKFAIVAAANGTVSIEYLDTKAVGLMSITHLIKNKNEYRKVENEKSEER